jgi:hypothetical protein
VRLNRWGPTLCYLASLVEHSLSHTFIQLPKSLACIIRSCCSGNVLLFERIVACTMPEQKSPAHRCHHCQSIVLRHKHFAEGVCNIWLPHSGAELIEAAKDGCELLKWFLIADPKHFHPAALEYRPRAIELLDRRVKGRFRIALYKDQGSNCWWINPHAETDVNKSRPMTVRAFLGTKRDFTSKTMLIKP